MPIRTSDIIIIYFVIGALLFGGGVVTWDDSGPTQFFVEMDGGDVDASSGPQENLSGVSGAITSLVGSVGGPVILVWNLFSGLVAFLNWPLFVLGDAGAPPRVTLLLGGTLTVMFYMSAIRLVRSSA